MTEQMKMDGGKNGGPVECLGMTFPSDDARREHFQKLLAEKPVGVKGISVPGMPIGSPGMEGPNPEKYDVVTINDAGKSEVFESY